jgi:DNA-binding transcriptional regulator YbjK
MLRRVERGVPTERRTSLADAAITVLAEEGMRGLTHRAVDREASVPPGTTSAYFRTRQALLTALVTRLVELDQDELETTGRAMPIPRDASELTDSIVQFTRQRLTGPGRRRTLARYACTIESVRHPELREILVPRDNSGHAAVRLFLAAHGVPEPAARAIPFLACVDGLVFARLVAGDGEVPREDVRVLVAAALSGPDEDSVGRTGTEPRPSQA